MNQLWRRRGAVVCGLFLGILLLAGCGSQSSQNTNALDRLSTAPASTNAATFGVTFVLPELQVPVRPGFTVKQPGLSGVALPETGAAMRITFERTSEADSQARAQAVAQHQCMH
jgi:hypothetical protein